MDFLLLLAPRMYVQSGYFLIIIETTWQIIFANLELEQIFYGLLLLSHVQPLIVSFSQTNSGALEQGVKGGHLPIQFLGEFQLM